MSLPVTVVNASDRDPPVQAADLIGWIMWSIGSSVEATADQQKLSFKNSPENRGKWCDVGLWRYTRHPNYFGEVCLVTSEVQLSLLSDIAHYDACYGLFCHLIQSFAMFL